MITYDKVRAIQQFRFGKHIQESRDRHRRRREHKTLSELIGALADGLEWIGIRGDEESHPASPAY